MGFEYEAIPNDVDDYRRRRDALALQIEILPTFARRYGPYAVGLDDGLPYDERWGDPVQLEFAEACVQMTCSKPLRGVLLADIGELLRMMGAAELVEL
ncbi:hypothetical protein [Lysobacter sp. CA199]|uniref:hypothetical protein n=1 Tax=Lysobacter sp. CA199 TaxID=3455608 RepID=UPI003F8D67EA